MSNIYKSKIFLLAIIWALAWANPALGQKQATYDGYYSLSYGLSGKANFKYTVAKKDTIKHGPFRFKSSFADATNGSSLRSVVISGAYQQNLKNGIWQYISKTVEPEGEFVEKDNQIVYEASGHEFLVKANFKNGEATGTWELLERKIRKSELADTISYVKAGFKNGGIAGTTEGVYNGTWFTGKVSDNGFIHGQWVFRPVAAAKPAFTEYRVYDQGHQTKHYFLFGADTLHLQYVGLAGLATDVTVWENTTLAGKYFDALESAHTGLANSTTKYQPALTDTTTALKTTTNNLLKNVFSAFAIYDKTPYWALTDGGEPETEVLARLHKIPYSSEEKANLESTNKLLSEANALFEEVLGNADLEISRFANRDLAFYHQLLKIYQQNLAAPNKLIKQFAKPSFEYVNREEILKHVIAETEFPDTVSYRFRDSTYVKKYSFPEIRNARGQDLPAVNRYLGKVVADITNIEKKIDALLESKLRESRLIIKEKELILLKDSVISLYANQPANERYNSYHGRVAENIQTFALEIFTQYALLPNQKKADTIEVLLQCYESFLRLYEVQADIPSKLKRLDEAYTRTVWNPFTMSHMEERMKSRIYNAFEQHVLPGYLQLIAEYKNCSELEKRYKSFDTIYARMIDLRNQDTKEISRKLRGNHSTRRVLEILELNLSGI